MIGLKFIKADPSTYIIKYRDGKIIKEGAGLSIIFNSYTSSLVSIPMASEDIFFMFNELTKDFQDVTVQGQVTCKVNNVHALTKMLNFTLDSSGNYCSEDPKKLPKRIINLIQVAVRKELAQLSLKNAMSSAENIAITIKSELMNSEVISSLGMEIIEFTIVAVKPNAETARALEAETREVLLKQADDAIYLRRNSAIEQERIIKENELKTDIAIVEKRGEIVQKKIETERLEQEMRNEMRKEEVSGRIEIQKMNQELVELTTANSIKEADAKAYAIKINVDALSKIDPKIIQVLVSANMDPSQLMAASFRELAENASRIGELNISPDLLNQIMKAKHE